MTDLTSPVPVEPPSMRCVQRRRTDEECMDLLDAVRSNPGQWYLFSLHKSQKAAHAYATNLNTEDHPSVRRVFRPYHAHLRFERLDYDPARGPAVGICWVP